MKLVIILGIFPKKVKVESKKKEQQVRKTTNLFEIV